MTPCVGKEGYPGVICLRISHLGSPVGGLLANGMAVLFILATCLLCPLLAHVTFEDPPSRASIGILRPKCKLPKVTSFPSNSPADRIVLVRISTTWRSSVEGPADSTTPATRVAVDYVVAKIPSHAISHQNIPSFTLIDKFLAEKVLFEQKISQLPKEKLFEVAPPSFHRRCVSRPRAPPRGWW